MQLTALFVGAALAVASATFVAFSGAGEAPRPVGHLIVQIEGDVLALRVTRITAKADPCGPASGVASEFAIVVRSDLKGLGLGHALLEKLVRYCRARGTRELVGQVLPDNRRMLELARTLGFRSRWLREEGVVEVRLALAREAAR